MKKYIAIIFFSLCSINIFPKAPKTPDWILDLDKAYSAKLYLRAVGTGNSESYAKDNAITSISMFFKTKAKVFNQAAQSYNQMENLKKDSVTKTSTLDQKIAISSESEFFGVEFSEPFYNVKEKKYYILAYINRENASLIYENKIESLLNCYTDLAKSIVNEKEPLYICFFYKKIKLISELLDALIENLILVDSSRSDKYEKQKKQVFELLNQYSDYNKNINFKIEYINGDKRFSSVATCISSILENNGFVVNYKKADYDYVVSFDLLFQEEVYETGSYVRSNIQISILNEKKELVESYSKNYPRYTHSTLDLSYARAVFKIQEDLEENFLSEYRVN